MNTRNSTLVRNNPEVNFETLRSDLHVRRDIKDVNTAPRFPILYTFFCDIVYTIDVIG